MTVRATIGYYKVKAILTHGACNYDYSLWPTEWVPSYTKVPIVCPIHGMFEQQISVHARGQGCRKCNPRKIAEGVRKGREYYLGKARSVHGDKYDYSLVPGDVKALDFVTIVCPVHGPFAQEMSAHAYGSSCRKCSIEATYVSLEKRMEQLNNVHDYKYDYSLLPNVVRAADKIDIVCPEHGIFKQKVNNHAAGQGCPSCARFGFNMKAPGYLYLMRSSDGAHMKIGITGNVRKRTKQLKVVTPFDLDLVFTKYFEKGEIARKAERAFHSVCKSAGFSGFGGCTEWFVYDRAVHEFLITL